MSEGSSEFLFKTAQKDQKEFLRDYKKKIRTFDHYKLTKDQDFMDLVSKLLESDPKRRIGPLEILEHKYVIEW